MICAISAPRMASIRSAGSGALNDAVSRDGRAAMIHVYLESLREATWVDPRDIRAGELLMAMVSVRLAS